MEQPLSLLVSYKAPGHDLQLALQLPPGMLSRAADTVERLAGVAPPALPLYAGDTPGARGRCPR